MNNGMKPCLKHQKLPLLVVMNGVLPRPMKYMIVKVS